MRDLFSNAHSAYDAPVSFAVAVTPSDAETLEWVTRAIYVGGAGDLTVDFARSGTAIKFTGVPAGTLLPIRATRVRSTGTTATGIVALW